MALFYYQALERNGRKTKGMIEADSARHARQLLRGKDLIPVHIEARMNASAGGLLQRRRHAHRRVAAADLALFTRQLATLVQAAMPLETCLQAVSEQSEKLHVKSLGMALRSRIQEGYTLSDSLREHPRVFDSLFCSMVAAGEKSGHLDVVLNRLADYTEQRQRLHTKNRRSPWDISSQYVLDIAQAQPRVADVVVLGPLSIPPWVGHSREQIIQGAMR